MGSLCHPCVTTTNLSYRCPIFDTSATALCSTTATRHRIHSTCILGTSISCADDPLVPSAVAQTSWLRGIERIHLLLLVPGNYSARKWCSTHSYTNSLKHLETKWQFPRTREYSGCCNSAAGRCSFASSCLLQGVGLLPITNEAHLIASHLSSNVAICTNSIQIMFFTKCRNALLRVFFGCNQFWGFIFPQTVGAEQLLPCSDRTAHPSGQSIVRKRAGVFSPLWYRDIYLYDQVSSYGYGSKPCTPGEHQNSW